MLRLWHLSSKHHLRMGPGRKPLPETLLCQQQLTDGLNQRAATEGVDLRIGSSQELELGEQARVVILPMGVGRMTGLWGNMDALAKTGAFPPSKRPGFKRVFLSANSDRALRTNVVSDDIAARLLVVFQLHHLFLFHFLK